MSRVRSTYTSGRKTYARSGGYGDYYVDGNTARVIDVREEIHKEPSTVANPDVQRRQARKQHMSVGYVLFFLAALSVSAIVLINYINLQADNKKLKEAVAKKESQLNTLKLSNDEEYSRILSAVDLEQVKDVAINELGMRYAEEGQVVVVETQGDDYVRQHQQMP